MRRNWILVIAVLFCTQAASSRASQPAPPGIPRFNVSLMPQGSPSVGKPFEILVRAGSFQHSRDALGDVRVRLPSGVELLEGDTNRVVHVSSYWMGKQDNVWRITVRATAPGSHEIRASMRVQGARQKTTYDEMEVRLTLDLLADSNRYDRDSRAVRYERVDAGRRFRYGGEHMVLIDGPEYWRTDANLDMAPPEEMGGEPAVCDCGLTEQRVVRFVVTVGSDGSVSWVEPRQRSEDPRVVAAATEEVRKRRFRPSLIQGKPVANWAVVDVAVQADAK